MPIYEYRCLHCQKNFEKLVLTSRKEVIVCPDCHDHHVEKQLSTFGLKLSGGKDPFDHARSSSPSSCGSCSSKNCSTCRS